MFRILRETPLYEEFANFDKALKSISVNYKEILNFLIKLSEEQK